MRDIDRQTYRHTDRQREVSGEQVCVQPWAPLNFHSMVRDDEYDSDDMMMWYEWRWRWQYESTPEFLCRRRFIVGEILIRFLYFIAENIQEEIGVWGQAERSNSQGAPCSTSDTTPHQRRRWWPGLRERTRNLGFDEAIASSTYNSTTFNITIGLQCFLGGTRGTSFPHLFFPDSVY